MANSAGTIALGFALVPAAITDLIGGLQVIYALLFGYIAAQLMPSIYSFDLTRKEVAYKSTCFMIMIFGLWLLMA